MKKILPVLVALAVPCASMASTVTINSVLDGQSYLSQHGIRDNTATTGHDLDGMVVTASYLDGMTERVAWGAVRSREAVGSAFDIFFSWRAFELSVKKTLVSLSMDARPGNAIFDIIRSTRVETEETYGTKRGYPFEVYGENDPEGSINVSYSNSVYVVGHTRATDAFTHMSIDFSGLDGGGLSGDLQFRTDLDSLALAGDLTPVSLPASSLMFASAFALLGFGIFRKRAVL